jgi:t-SNARE complex subunit (syntaxin)
MRPTGISSKGNSNSNSSKGNYSYDKLSTREYDDNIDVESHSGRSQLFDSHITQQNRHLDNLEASVQRLGSMSLNISQEIDDQNRMLDSLTHDTSNLQSNADILLQRTNALVNNLNESSPRMCWIICVLTMIFVILVLLVIYT